MSNVEEVLYCIRRATRPPPYQRELIWEFLKYKPRSHYPQIENRPLTGLLPAIGVVVVVLLSISMIWQADVNAALFFDSPNHAPSLILFVLVPFLSLSAQHYRASCIASWHRMPSFIIHSFIHSARSLALRAS